GEGDDTVNLLGTDTRHAFDDLGGVDIDFGPGTTSTSTHLGLGNHLTIEGAVYARLESISGSHTVVVDSVSVGRGSQLITGSATTSGDIDLGTGGIASFEARVAVRAESQSGFSATSGTFTVHPSAIVQENDQFVFIPAGDAIFTGGANSSLIHI